MKKPEESKYPGDYYKLRATIPADEAFRPLKDGNCPLVQQLTLRSAVRSHPPPPRRREATPSVLRCSKFSVYRRKRCSGQLLLGLINGSFYALLSLGLAVIFGMLNIINFAHGAQYMMGAFTAYMLLQYFGIGYWPALIVAPIVIGAFGIVIERLFLKRLHGLDHLYGLMLTFGLALIIEGVFRNYYGSSGQPYAVPERCRRPRSRLHVPAELSRLGDRLLARRLLRHLVCDRADQARLLSARGDRKSDAGARLRHQRAAHGDADLRLRRRRWPRSPA